MKKILVIEDEAIIRLNLLNLLDASGFNTIGTGNGVIGLTLVGELMPDLIICNVKLRGLNGYEVFRALRSESTTATIPFLFLTAQIDIDLISQEDQTYLRYLSKPFVPNELLATIAELLGSEFS